jgi:hypothetical protein
MRCERRGQKTQIDDVLRTHRVLERTEPQLQVDRLLQPAHLDLAIEVQAAPSAKRFASGWNGSSPTRSSSPSSSARASRPG